MSRPAADASPSSSRRPLLSVLFPELAGFIQPLGGEYAGRRDVLEAVPFVEGWGVEIGLLVDIVARVGLGATAQVDLGVREHRNRPLDELGAQATSILVTALRRAGLTDIDHTTLTRFTEAFEPQLVDVDGVGAAADRDRPRVLREVRARAARRRLTPHADADRHGDQPACRAPPRPPRRAARPRANASPACHTRSVSASTVTSPSTDASSRASSVTWPAMTPRRRDVGVGRELEHAAHHLAGEARGVELALAGDHELGADERVLEPDEVGDDVEAGLEARADRGEPAGEPAGRARRLERR